MQFNKTIMSVLLCTSVLVACDQKEKVQEKPLKIETSEQKAEYAIARSLALSLEKDGLVLDADVLAAAIKDVAMHQAPRVTEQEMAQAMTELQTKLGQKKSDEQKRLSETNQLAEKKFLEENKKKEGVLTTPNGLQYKIIQKGTGAKPKADDTVSLNYVGKLIDGTEFDSSQKLGQPLSIQVKAGLPGWGEIIPMMPKGSKWEVYVPAKLAFGDEGNSKVPPSALVIYELELLDSK